MSRLPACEHLELRQEGWRLHVTLNRPYVRNAMSFKMVEEIMAVFDALHERHDIRAVILRGAGGNFCSGGDIKDMAAARQAEVGADGVDPLAHSNRLFGAMLTEVNRAPQAVIAIIEGAAMGGGFGLACVSDVAVAHVSAVFKLPETSLGVPPAQIAPFIVQRLGITQARRLAVTGGKIDAAEAHRLGLVHYVAGDAVELEQLVDTILAQIHRCAPAAIGVTKALMLRVGEEPIEELLNRGAHQFAAAIRGPEGVEGTVAFLQKRKPKWAHQGED
ncbi:MAG: enoyl-CoA hydratase/isomerase family protein [Myxococcales bacterium]|nr:enoyl-CoA hydratase/isomerase family protein [Myxococcales bacterium]